MSAVLIPTTTITVERVLTSDETDYDVAFSANNAVSNKSVVVTGVQASITRPAGVEMLDNSAEVSQVKFTLTCDPCDIRNTDIVIDEQSKETYQVLWVEHRYTLLGEYMQGELRRDIGATYTN